MFMQRGRLVCRATRAFAGERTFTARERGQRCRSRERLSARQSRCKRKSTPASHAEDPDYIQQSSGNNRGSAWPTNLPNVEARFRSGSVRGRSYGDATPKLLGACSQTKGRASARSNSPSDMVVLWSMRLSPASPAAVLRCERGRLEETPRRVLSCSELSFRFL